MKKLNMQRRMRRLQSPAGLTSMILSTVGLAATGLPMETVMFGGGVVGTGIVFGDLAYTAAKTVTRNMLNPGHVSLLEKFAMRSVQVVDTEVVTLAQTATIESTAVEAKEKPYKRGGDPVLDLAPDCKPRLNGVLGRGVLIVGMRGSGKSYFAARLIEEIAKFPIAQLIFDYKRDYITLPSLLPNCVIAGSPDWKDPLRGKSYWKVTQENAAQAGLTLLQNGLQVVLQVQSYETLAEAAEIMTLMLNAMRIWQTAQEKKVPCVVLLDEAQQILPQNFGDAKTNLTPEIAAQVFNAFEKVNSVGRSLGFTPIFATQRVAQLRKEVIGGSEIYFLMKSTMPQDLTVYEDIVGKDEKGKQRVDRRVFQEMHPGDGLVFEGGEMLFTHFNERRTEHLSSTPGLEAAENFYAGKRLTKSLVPTTPKFFEAVEPTYREEYKTLTGIDLDEDEDGPDTEDLEESPRPYGNYSEHDRGYGDRMGTVVTGTLFTPSELPVSAPVRSVPVTLVTGPHAVPALGPDHRRFTEEQAQEFLLRYHKKPAAIKEILKQMNNGEGLSNRYCKHAGWLLQQELQEV